MWCCNHVILRKKRKGGLPDLVLFFRGGGKSLHSRKIINYVMWLYVEEERIICLLSC